MVIFIFSFEKTIGLALLSSQSEPKGGSLWTVLGGSVSPLFTAMIKKLNHITRHNLLILDDFGLHPLQEADQLILYDLIDDMTHKNALILTSPIPVEHWHQLITQSTLADAVIGGVARVFVARIRKRGYVCKRNVEFGRGSVKKIRCGFKKFHFRLIQALLGLRQIFPSNKCQIALHHQV